MKNHFLMIGTFVFLVLIFTACNSRQNEIVLENNTELLRVDEPIVITRAEIEKVLGNAPEGQFPVLISAAGDTIPTQADDLTGDGKWDELFLLIDLEPKSQIRLNLVYVDRLPEFTVRTNVRLAQRTTDGQFREVSSASRLNPEQGLATNDIFHHEGIAWENDLVGFRNYLDVRNGMDIFGKTTTDMILDRAGIGEDYHFMQDWGMDILMVGRSLGSGAIALEKEGNVLRIAPEAKGSASVLIEGPLRSVIRLSFEDWMINETTYNLHHDISIHGGAWYYDSKVYFDGLQNEVSLITGITTIALGEKEAVVHEFNKITAVATHAAQAYDKEYLGMAVMLQTDRLGELERWDADEELINNSIAVKIPVNDDTPVRFRFYSAWEVSDERFADEAFFSQMLEQEALKWANPVKVRVR
jgi:hypothetical protein